jgi:hypothetical protein
VTVFIVILALKRERASNAITRDRYLARSKGMGGREYARGRSI